jgi:hypothetical protein
MGIFDSILKEAIEDLKKEETPEEEKGAFSKTGDDEPEEDKPEEKEETTDEEPSEDEEPEEDEPDENSPQSKLKNLCFDILDAIESESLVSGDSFDEEDESVDIGIEVLVKFADSFDDETCEGMMKILSEYFEMEYDEGSDEEDEDYFEEPKEEEDETEFESDKVEEPPKGAFSNE